MRPSKDSIYNDFAYYADCELESGPYKFFSRVRELIDASGDKGLEQALEDIKERWRS